jgi:hypothetical protein
VLLLGFGGVFGIDAWVTGIKLGRGATSGTVMVAALPVIIGFQLWLAAIMYDVMKTPRTPIHPFLIAPRRKRVLPGVADLSEPAPSLVPDDEQGHAAMAPQKETS